MKILNLIPNLSGGGAERQLNYLAPELVRMGHEVHIAYSREGSCKPELPGVVLHQLKSRSNYDPYLFWQLVRLIRGLKPDIVHTWIPQMDILGGMAARINGVPWIFREPSSPIAYKSTLKNSLRVRIGSGASAIVANSLDGAEYWKIKVQHKRCYVVLNGLPIQKIESTPAALPSGLPQPEMPIVLYVGRLVELKNLKVFMEVLACVKKQRKVFGVICGEGPQQTELETLRCKLGLEADLYFTGYLPPAAVWALVKKAAIFISLSAYEGCPNAVMEAMACDCPLVIADIPAHHEILDEGCARFVPISNISQVADTIVQALRDPDASMQRAVIAKIKTQKWSIAEMAKNWENVYKEVV